MAPSNVAWPAGVPGFISAGVPGFIVAGVPGFAAAGVPGFVPDGVPGFGAAGLPTPCHTHLMARQPISCHSLKQPNKQAITTNTQN